MKRFTVALVFLLFAFKSFAQNGIHAFQAIDSIGKVVTVTAKVVSFHKIPNSNTVSLGISDFRNKLEVLTLLVHQTHYKKSNTEWLQSLTGQLIRFKGKVLNHNGQPTIKLEFEQLNIEEVVAIPEVEATVKETQPAGKNITANEAINHIGEFVTICDTAYSYIAGDNLLVLNFGKSPDQLTIASKNQSNIYHFDAAYLKGKHLCVTGTLILYNNKPQIFITDPLQIYVKQY